MKNARWQDWVMMLLGIWLFFSPFILRYSDLTLAAANSYILGVGVFAFASAAIAKPERWEEWVNLALGVWLIVSPFLLGFGTQNVPTLNHMVLGVLIGGDAILAMVQYPMRKAASK